MSLLLLRIHPRNLLDSHSSSSHSIQSIRRNRAKNLNLKDGNRNWIENGRNNVKRFHVFSGYKQMQNSSNSTGGNNGLNREKLIPYLTFDPNGEVDNFKIPKILVIGVGGAGGNVVNLMTQKQNLENVLFVSANTDAQALSLSKAPVRIQLGKRGLGAGADPKVGRDSAMESLGEVVEHIDKADMVFVLAGMGGGTGTGASPVIASAAKERGILTVGIVTTPFTFEGSVKERLSKEGIEELEKAADSLVVIPNQKMLEVEKKVEGKSSSFMNSFDEVNEHLSSGIQTVSELLSSPGFVNVDLSDLQTTMRGKGRAYIGNGEAKGEGRALKAAKHALFDPFGDLDESVIRSAQNILVNIYGGEDLDRNEVQEITSLFRKELNQEAHVIFGTVINKSYNDTIKVSLIASGLDVKAFEDDKIAKLVSDTQEKVQKALDDPQVKNLKESFFKFVRRWW